MPQNSNSIVHHTWNELMGSKHQTMNSESSKNFNKYLLWFLFQLSQMRKNSWTKLGKTRFVVWLVWSHELVIAQQKRVNGSVEFQFQTSLYLIQSCGCNEKINLIWWIALEEAIFQIVQVILFEIDCAIFSTKLHEMFCQFIIWTNWVNSGKLMDNCCISCQVMADMKKVWDDLIIINL